MAHTAVRKSLIPWTKDRDPLTRPEKSHRSWTNFEGRSTAKAQRAFNSVLLNPLFDGESRDVLQSFFNRDDPTPHFFCAVVKVANCFVNFRRESYSFRLCSSRFEPCQPI